VRSERDVSDVRFVASEMTSRSLCRLFTAVLCALSVNGAKAWGTEGHRLVVLIAEEHISVVARERLNELLAVEPGATLESISTWADEVRSPSTSKWHYVNFPRGSCTYVADRDCPDGQCVVAALERQAAILHSDASSERRLKALKYLVHFVADVHQPLHAGFGDDRGGNRYQV